MARTLISPAACKGQVSGFGCGTWSGFQHEHGFGHDAQRRLMAEAALAAAAASRRDGVGARHGLAALPHAPGASGEPGDAARLYRRQHAPELARLHRALCRGRRAVAARGRRSHRCRRLSVWLVHRRRGINHRRHDRRHHRLPHRQNHDERRVGGPGRTFSVPLSPGISARRL